MDKLVSMRAYAKVVEHGSFSKAAREMRLSRSAVSKYVIDLEQELGVQLLNRTTRSASPTDTGRVYYDRCVAILGEIEEADLMVAHLQAEPRGLLRSMRRCRSARSISAARSPPSWSATPSSRSS